MGLSQSRANSAATNQGFHLRKAVKVQEIPEQREVYDERQAQGLYASMPNYEVIGECGHRLHVIGAYDARSLVTESAKIHDGKPRRRRCENCPKEPTS